MSSVNYFLGLDIGTDSVGWAVTDRAYNVVRKKGKSLWGVRLFDESKTAEERRTFRTARRRNDRKKQRIRLLQELLAEEVNKVDNKFFARLRDSAFWQEDKEESQIYSLFNDVGFNDVNYNEEYPTIYHLKKALLTEDKKFDIRLIYLALHHSMKNRGHFLFNGSIEKVTAFINTFDTFRACLEEELEIFLECASIDEFENTLKNKNINKTKKCSELERICGVDKSDKQLKEIFKLIVGLNCNLNVVFNDDSMKENEHNKISFSNSNYEDTVRPALDDEIYEKAEIIDVFNSVYSWVILSDILDGGDYQGNSYLSIAKVRVYEKHKADLKLLKAVVKEYLPEEYNNFFVSDKENNYCSLIGHYTKNGKKYKDNIKRCSREDFDKALKALLKKIDADIVQDILLQVENKIFLPTQVSKDNGIIPYQVHKIELETILRNAEKYYPVFKEVDEECGKTLSEKIIALFEFRIPYYVGPLNTSKGENAWMVRKEEGSIRPWNFEQKVDKDKSAAEFINRMTNQCTYLTSETVLPKYSLVYSEYMVLNELNNVKIKGEKLSVELKQDVFENLFKLNKQVTGKKLLDYLNSMGYDLVKEDLSGFDGNFKSSLSSYITLKKEIFGDDMDKYSVCQMAEDIILWVTLYGDAKDILKNAVKKKYSDKINAEQLKKICRLKFNGWGRLSKAFLQELEGVDYNTGEKLTIIQGLRETQNNLMQLLSNNYSFLEEIENENSDFRLSGEITYDKLVKDIVASPSIKRAVWQTVQIVEEIKNIMGGELERIFVEMARGPEEKKERKDSRKDKLLKLYESIKDETAKGLYNEILGTEENRFKSIKLYLYYTQMGRCMYTGKKIDLSQLENANIWDRDHIYPQSKTKDDSLDNLVLVDRVVNAKKDNGLISSDIQKKMYPFWKFLKDKELITEKKFFRLIKTTPLTEEELAGFINRQLVEARQSTKVIATLFKRMYSDTDIVYVKAKNVSDFRNKDNVFGVKSRSVNDYHHAKDAYLNIVVGNVYYTKFTDNPLHWLKKNKNAEYSLNRMYDYNLEKNGVCVWEKGENGTIKTINKYLLRNDVLYTRYAYCNKGEFFDQMPLKAGKSEKLVPRKQGLDPKKYGGYNSVTPAYFVLLESKDKKGNLIRTIEAMPLYLVKYFEKNEAEFLKYCENTYGLKEPRVVLPKIKKNALLVVNGFPMHLRSTTGKQLKMQGAIQMCIDYEYIEYIKKLEKYLEANAKRSDKKTLLKIDEYMKLSREENIKLFNLLVDKLKNSVYKLRPANPCDKLLEKKEKFENISIEEQCVVLGEMIKLFQCKQLTADLRCINGSKDTGNMAISKTISGCKQFDLIHQSSTGLYEYTVDLLKL